MNTFKIGQVVKYKNPAKGEENTRFFVNEIHEDEGENGEKLHVEQICDEHLKPTFCYFADEFEPSFYTAIVEYKGKKVESYCYGRL